MTDTPKRYDPFTLASIYKANGGDDLLEDCQTRHGEVVYFSSENVRHPGTVAQQKRKYLKPGFKLVEIVYTHADQTSLHSIKYLYVNGQEYRVEHTPRNAYSLKE